MNESGIFDELVEIFGDSPTPLSQAVIMRKIEAVNHVLSESGGNVEDVMRRIRPTKYNPSKALSHEAFPTEYLVKFAELLLRIQQGVNAKNFSILEIGAGRGQLGRHLTTQLPVDLSLHITDICPLSNSVEAVCYQTAIRKYEPDIVIACWPDFVGDAYTDEEIFLNSLRDTPQVLGCFLIGVPFRCRFGERWLTHLRYRSPDDSFAKAIDVLDLTRLHIGFPNRSSINAGQLINGINPLILPDQGQNGDGTQYLGMTCIISRTYFISRYRLSELDGYEYEELNQRTPESTPRPTKEV